MLIIFRTIIRIVESYGNNKNEHIIPALAPSISGLGERQANDQAVQQAGMQQGCEDQLKFDPSDQQAH